MASSQMQCMMFDFLNYERLIIYWSKGEGEDSAASKSCTELLGLGRT